MTAEEYLLDRFGPLMSMVQMASLLDRSPDGFRVEMYTDSDLSRKLKPTVVRVGRRVFFRTIQANDALGLDGKQG
ncbi:DNA-binding protein [Pseudomonas capsici]|uniref:DNA-binding protein n=1 Tax=Pseudomonas capsici TaxID=2810614 RepID=UPI001C8A384B|nr:DNA-binding protein [Pseudomonas capsici]MBX8612817.1 DNA-binding protein [Pseudomonas cichorii]MCV4287446.1 DNA-binding protein [Pseudomonas capsici]